MQPIETIDKRRIRHYLISFKTWSMKHAHRSRQSSTLWYSLLEALCCRRHLSIKRKKEQHHPVSSGSLCLPSSGSSHLPAHVSPKAFCHVESVLSSTVTAHWNPLLHHKTDTTSSSWTLACQTRGYHLSVTFTKWTSLRFDHFYLWLPQTPCCHDLLSPFCLVQRLHEPFFLDRLYVSPRKVKRKLFWSDVELLIAVCGCWTHCWTRCCCARYANSFGICLFYRNGMVSCNSNVGRQVSVCVSVFALLVLLPAGGWHLQNNMLFSHPSNCQQMPFCFVRLCNWALVSRWRKGFSRWQGIRRYTKRLGGQIRRQIRHCSQRSSSPGSPSFGTHQWPHRR